MMFIGEHTQLSTFDVSWISKTLYPSQGIERFTEHVAGWWAGFLAGWLAVTSKQLTTTTAGHIPKKEMAQKIMIIKQKI